MNYVSWINVYKGIAIILVVMGHSLSNKIANFIFLFHMPLFFFISGYLFNFDKYSSCPKLYFKNSAIKLLLPQFLYSFIFYDWSNFYVFLSIIYGSGKPIANLHIISIFWFLYCLFLVRILLFYFVKFTKKFNLFTNIIISFSFVLLGVYLGKYKLPWSFDIALVALYISYIGYIFKSKNLLNNKTLKFIIIPTFILTYFDYKYFGLSMNERFYSNPLISINTAILLSLLTCYLSMYISSLRFKKLKLFLEYLGVNSLSIYILHCYYFAPIKPIFLTIYRIIFSVVGIEILSRIPYINTIFSLKSFKEVSKY